MMETNACTARRRHNSPPIQNSVNTISAEHTEMAFALNVFTRRCAEDCVWIQTIHILFYSDIEYFYTIQRYFEHSATCDSISET